MNTEHFFESTTGAVLKIVHENENEMTVDVLMPIWITEVQSELEVKLALLGLPEFYIQDLSELDEAVNEALQLFIMACKKHGNGIEQELIDLGWSMSTKTNQNSTFNIFPEKDAYGQMMNTGKKFENRLQMQC